MTAMVNGEVCDLPYGSTIGALLRLLGMTGTGVAVAQNDSVVRRTQFDSQPIAEGDRIEIIRAVAGG
ncbi:MAG: sulfur carrier protein ThiS [Candidatus Eremiobacteraeota bacterium]|nr:sulfur carrier protein ThiS [Candidatus Eremiobacteraeota bacterium]MBV8374529.1 sulfur carrier protein ThiS [Candidatus Eremiobacteraeota bacterium]